MDTNYDSGNLYLDKLNSLIIDMELDDSKYNTWEIDFLINLNEQKFELEVGDLELTTRQEIKIDEMYEKHLED